jgi:hypothetical protein
LLDTGVFGEDRYFDVFVEYAKAATTDMLIRISVANRGPEPAALQLLPTLWFRNSWAWWPDRPKPSLQAPPAANGAGAIAASHADLGQYLFYCEGNPALLFMENDTNNERLFGTPNATPYVKDAFNDYVVAGRGDAVNPNRIGTKAAALYSLTLPGVRLGQSGFGSPALRPPSPLATVMRRSLRSASARPTRSIGRSSRPAPMATRPI